MKLVTPIGLIEIDMDRHFSLLQIVLEYADLSIIQSVRISGDTNNW